MSGTHRMVACSECRVTLIRAGRRSKRCFKCYAATHGGDGSPQERLNARIIVAPSGCWEIQGSRDRYGYGNIRGFGHKLAHRVSWVIHNGPIPPETPDVLHHCDNPPCVNPAHLFLGTQADNNHDRDAKGRGLPGGFNCKGEAHHQAKLTTAQVLTIRASSKPSKELAAEFGVHWAHINRIKRGAKWAHLQAEVAA